MSATSKVSGRMAGRATMGLLLAAALGVSAHAESPGWAARDGDPGTVPVSVRTLMEPGLFGFATVKLGPTIYDNIWREASSAALPNNNTELDATVARLRTMPMSARVKAANAWVNARVAYRPDGTVTDHHWGNLAKVLARGCGAHEDIAIAKLQLLAAAGVPRRAMYMVMVRDLSRLATDALLVVRDDDQTYVLDSQHDGFIDAGQTGRYFPVLALGSEGRWLYGRRATPSGARTIASAY